MQADLLISRNISDSPQEMSVQSNHSAKVLLQSNHSSIAVAAGAGDVLWELNHGMGEASEIHLTENGGYYDKKSFTITHNAASLVIAAAEVDHPYPPDPLIETRKLLTLNQDCEPVQRWSGAGETSATGGPSGSCGRLEIAANLQVCCDALHEF